MATVTGAIGTGSRWLLDRIVGVIAATGINPNVLTSLDLVVNRGAAVMFAVGRFRTGGLFDRMAGVLWVIAVVSTLTVIHRIVYTWQETRAGRTLPGIKISL